MSYLTAFTEKLAGLNANLDTYTQKYPDYAKKIPHQLLGGIVESFSGAANFAQEKAKELVAHLKVHEAYTNHGLNDDAVVVTKQLKASIDNNPEQFNQAFERHQKISDDKIFEPTQNIAHAKTVTDKALNYANILLNAVWKDGTELPTDENPKWVWLTDGFFTYLEKNARFNLKENKWDIKHETSDPYFKIHHWMDLPTI